MSELAPIFLAQGFGRMGLSVPKLKTFCTDMHGTSSGLMSQDTFKQPHG